MTKCPCEIRAADKNQALTLLQTPDRRPIILSDAARAAGHHSDQRAPHAHLCAWRKLYHFQESVIASERPNQGGLAERPQQHDKKLLLGSVQAKQLKKKKTLGDNRKKHLGFYNEFIHYRR